MRSSTKVERPRNVQELRAWHVRVGQARQELAARLAGTGSSGVFFGAGGPTLIVPERGHDDVASVAWTPDGTSTVSLRDGRTGRVRWTNSVPLTTTVAVAHLGPKHTTALVAFETTFTGTDQFDPIGLEGTGEQVTTVVAYDAESGKQIWASQPVNGIYTVSPVAFAEADALYFGGILHDRAGDRILASELTDENDGFNPTTIGQAVVFDGATGEQTTSGQTLSSQDLFIPTPAGDLTRDGLSDWYDVTDGGAGSIDAESGADGSQLWTQDESSAFFPYAVPMPDLNNDRRPDVIVADQGSEQKSALSGANGAPLWSRSGGSFFPLGRLSHGEGVGLLSYTPSGITVTAVVGHGDTAWTRSFMPPRVKGDFSTSAVRYGFAGDVDGDGVQDFYLSVAYINGDKTATYTDLVSGRSGAVRRGRLIGTAIGGSLDGRGDDFLVTGGGTKTWTAGAFDGRSRTKLWSFTTKSSGDYSFGSVAGVGRFGHGGDNSVLISLQDQDGSRMLAIDGVTGHLEWQVVQPNVDQGFVVD